MARNAEIDFGSVADMSVKGPLDGTIVTAVVGGGRNSSGRSRRAREYHVHYDLLSPMLKDTVDEATMILQLPDEDPVTFNLFIAWLYPRSGTLPRVPDLSRYTGAGAAGAAVAVPRTWSNPTQTPQRSVWGAPPPPPLPLTPPTAAHFVPRQLTDRAVSSFPDTQVEAYMNLCVDQQPWAKYSQEELRLHYQSDKGHLATHLRALRATVVSLQQRRAPAVAVATPTSTSTWFSNMRAAANPGASPSAASPGRAQPGTATREAVTSTFSTLNISDEQGAARPGAGRDRDGASDPTAPTENWEDTNASTDFHTDNDDGDDKDDDNDGDDDDDDDDDNESAASPNIPWDVARKAEEVQDKLLDLLLFAETYVLQPELFREVFDAFVEGERRLRRANPPLEFVARCGRHSRETVARAGARWARRKEKEFVVAGFVYDWVCARAMDGAAVERYARLLRRELGFAAGVLRRVDDALKATSRVNDAGGDRFQPSILAGEEDPLDPGFRYRYRNAYPSYLGPRE